MQKPPARAHNNGCHMVSLPLSRIFPESACMVCVGERTSSCGFELSVRAFGANLDVLTNAGDCRLTCVCARPLTAIAFIYPIYIVICRRHARELSKYCVSSVGKSATCEASTHYVCSEVYGDTHVCTILL